MLAIEKMWHLKKVPLFKFVSDEILLSIAEATEECFISAGSIIMEKGQIADSLFVILQGKVGVLHDHVEVAVLRDREIFGERLFLSPEPCSTTVTAIEDTNLLIVPQTTLAMLLEMSPSLCKGIIQYLCQRLRETSKNQAGYRDV